MAFPASQSSLVNALQRVQHAASTIRNRVLTIRNQAAAGPVDRERLIVLLSQLTEALDHFSAAASVPGLAQYARDQFGDQGLDIAAEFAAMQSQATGLRSWIATNFPTGAGGAWLVHSFDVTGARTSLQFTTGQLAGFVTQADAFIATIS